MRRKAPLVVPIRDRRRGRRILTLRNARNAGIVLLILFAVITIRSEMRKPQPGDFGGLYSSEVARNEPVTARQPDVVREVPPAPDQTAADPMLVAPAAREQYLGVNAPPQQAATVVPSQEDFPH